ncbi:hypothetical protein C900_02831 [Fulvivirga imtechensis AK7]|uniref:Uncharacterized protein n=1 Tax=Fulvivirga imtechensis AK7 TaxID=1237149 RepID=L8JT43_9BACT|nr:hypothetical protein [Fulvivirga imtechensis]ELR71373.1 hypothetical protein C900_02831 [Fulvivirga imtechensis AK7]
MESTLQKPILNLDITFENANVYLVNSADAVLVEASGTYITNDEFKNIFHYVGSLVISNGIKKLVFDKRTLKIFHQPSMEWYFVVWKEKMYTHGLKTYRKILPQSSVFRESVRISQEKINKKYPNAKCHNMDIKYSETLEEAINN